MLVFRDHGFRENRQKTRLMWLVEELGEEAFAALVAERMGVSGFAPAVKTAYDDVWERRDVLGVHPQKQEGLSWVCFSCSSPFGLPRFALVSFVLPCFLTVGASRCCQ